MEINYAEEYIKYTDDAKNVNKTFNDFFKHIGVKKKNRSEFLIKYILQQVKKMKEQS